MHRLSLYGTISNESLKSTLLVLSGLSGMAPEPYTCHECIFEPIWPYHPKVQPGQVNQIEQYIIRLCRHTKFSDNLHRNDNNRPLTERDLDGFRCVPFSNSKHQQWELIVCDIPEAGTQQKVTSQSIITTKIKNGNPSEFLESLGYKLKSEYWSRGYMLIYDSKVIIKVYRLHVSNTTETGSIQIPTRLIDTTERWMIHCYVDISSSTDQEAIETGTNSLLQMKAEVNGLVDLVMPDRRSLDGRLRR